MNLGTGSRKKNDRCHHRKANANKKKHRKEQAEFTALRQEINKKSKGSKEITVSTTNPNCGLFHKGEHKVEFAYTCKKGIDDGKEIMTPTKNR
mgnify:CR=1 FL=1